MEGGFLKKLTRIVKPEKKVTPENVTELLYNLLPDLESVPATMENFSSLDFGVQKEIYINCKKQKDANVNDGEILQYAFNFINGRKDFAESLTSPNSDQEYKPKLHPLVLEAEEYGAKNAAELLEQFKKIK